MQIVRKNQANKVVGSSTTTIFEYIMDELGINGAIAVINGRYPEKRFATNTISKELVLVLDGSGAVGLVDKEVPIEKGDCLLLMPNEKFYWKGIFTLFTVCTPAWKPEQHKIAD